MRYNRNWEKTGSAILAVCLIVALLLSNQSFGVFAEEEQSQAVTQEEVQSETVTEESNQDVEGFVSSDVTENDDESSSDETENDDADIELTPEDGFYSEQDVVLDPEEEGEAETDEDDISTFSDSGDENTWQCQKDNVTVEGTGTDIQSISVERGTNEKLYTGDKFVAFDYNIISENTTTGDLTFTISDVGIMSDDESLEIWHVKDNAIEKINSELQISEGKVQFKATEFGEFIAVSNVATVDLAQSTEKTSIRVSENITIEKTGVNISYNSLKGCRQDGTPIDIAIFSNGDRKYRVAQSKNERIKNSIWFSGEFATNRNIIIDGINTDGSIDIAANSYQKLVSLQLRGENQVHHIGYGYGLNNHNSKLVIENYGIASDTSGKLYVPYKMNDRTEERNYIFQTGASQYWAYAGIGGNQEVGSNMYGLTIAGGTIRVITQNKDGSTAIGAGGNGDAQLNITGGDITAICSSTGTAIGGGIGWLYRGGTADISITGGKVYAENVKYRSAGAKVPNGDDLGNIEFGGVAIGSGSSVVNVGSSAKINIGGNSQVTAYARYGNGIGSGNSYNGTAATANITIDGNSSVKTNALGGGTSKTGQGGSANITVKDGAIVNCIEYSQIEDKWDTETNNILDAFGIGGGSSAGEAKGGNAVVNVSGGFLNCNGGNIGGGDATGTGAGGDASIYVSGGTLNCASIGAGNSVSGTPGAVTSSTYSAGVVVTGGTLNAGTIGGGMNNNGDIGFATVDISGGNIQGQFILSNTDTNKKCAFTMSGGTIDNTALWSDAENSKYQMVQKNGGAVYMTDPNGEVNISGGTIKNCKAELGGAVYMTAGTVTLSETGKILNCVATGNTENNIEAQGGAIYLKDGTVNVSGGEISECSAVNGAAVYMQGGSMAASGGSIKNNTATESGGGAYLAAGNLDISGGNFTENTAPKGAGAYLAGGNLNLSGTGTFNLNNASENGGAAYLANGILTLDGGTVSSNTATNNGGGFYVADGAVRMFGGNITGNHADQDGGGFYVSSAKNAANVVIRSGSIIGNTSGGSGAGMAVVGGENVREDTVVLGLLEKHEGLTISEDNVRSFSPFDYTDTVDSTKHNHASCPVLQNNIADGDGGGVYMQSSAAKLNIYCLKESGNTSKTNANGNGVMMAGGNLVIGDEQNNNKDAWGNTDIGSLMLVEGGNVDIWGNMDNPSFDKNILVNIKDGAGKFIDHRKQASNKKQYKIQYFENFTAGGTQTASGMCIANQYDEKDKIYADGTLFKHDGWRILGWATAEVNESNKNNHENKVSYSIGAFIGGLTAENEYDHKAWGDNDTEPLVLYAVWDRSIYTVNFQPNAATYEGSMADQMFSYAVEQSLSPNQYKVIGKRFTGWKDKNGIDYAANYSDSRMTPENNDSVVLYAQWVDCTHKNGEYPGTLSYTIDEETNTIIETCDCEGHTASIGLVGPNGTIYHDGNAHPATITHPKGTLLAAAPTISYKFCDTENGTYTEMTDGKKPTEKGFYEASITVGDKTISVRYQIQSASDTVSVDAECIDGQQFGPFNGSAACRIAKDDAFTVWYSVRNLNNNYDSTEPSLVMNQSLPAGTAIIMQLKNAESDAYSYWYKNIETETAKISLKDFSEMGETANHTFSYQFSSTQEYRFVFDFSKVAESKQLSGTLEAELIYKHNSSDNDSVKKSVKITLDDKGTFSLSGTAESMLIKAPQDKSYSRWDKKNLVLVVTAKGENQFPADARLTVEAGGKTYAYSKDVGDRLVVPIAWTSQGNVKMYLNSDLLSSEKSYPADVKLCVGDEVENSNNQPQAEEYETGEQVTGISLRVSDTTAPSLRIEGTQKAVKKTDTLNLKVTMAETDNCTVHATIQQKEASGYDGDFLSANVAQGDNQFSLGGIKEAGSYRLLITVTKNNQAVLTVPYYFIVQ